jgi:isoleucyl-tRNA synthetase
MFREVPSTLDFPALEQDVLRFWRETRAFEQLVAKNRGKARWSFVDGPITANNPMGVHHAWGRTYKDLFQRYKAMRGYDQRYQNGFDCQGLWVEVHVEKELGFTSKRDIDAYGVERFVNACKERVLRYAAVQTEQSIRLGYWMDWDHSYYTMSDENNYSIWHFLKRCHERGLIYRGQDAMPWCPRCATGISQHEIATEGYEEVTHTSIYAKLPLLDLPGESLLVWTTTPWTLPANVAAAVNPALQYARVRQGDDTFYVSKGALATAVHGRYVVTGEVTGADMAGWRYRGLFDDLPAVEQSGAPDAHRVITWGGVSDTEGTGIVHIAPGCGKEDFELGKLHGLPIIAAIDALGVYLQGYDWLTGRAASDVPQAVARDLEARGLLYRTQPYTHRYPHCWRCGSQLVFRLVDEWFISMDGPKGDAATPTADATPSASSPPADEHEAGHEDAPLPPLREQIMEVARKARWLPPWGLDRELDWLRNMGDWMISKKNRYWGLALPFWECHACGWWDVVGGDEELKRRAVAGWQEFEGHTPHKPWIDAVKIACGRCGAPATRTPDVGNPWLDAGIVPFSTLGYRHDRDHWEQWFPADFITESFPGQFRNWFYSLLTMSTVLENRAPFRAVLGYGLLRDERGEEMHKSKGNSIEFNEAADRIGASVMRWLFTGANPEANLNFGFALADDVKRRLLTLWNVYAFFCTYARLDGFDPTTSPVVPPSERPLLDRWVLAELHALVRLATERYDAFDAMAVTRRMEAFIDDLSNWYVRRGRPRYWRSESDADKLAAYRTLWEVLSTLSRLLAPAMPFLAEALYQNLVRSVDASAPESVHHTSWPAADESLIDAPLREAMALVREVVGLGRSARQKGKLRVRQPLAALLVRVGNERERDALRSLEDQVRDELNVKRLDLVEDTAQLVTQRVRPNLKLLGPRFGAKVNAVAQALQAARPAELVRQREAGEDVALVAGGFEVVVHPEEFDVESVPAEGYTVVEEGGRLVALDTRLTPELIEDGLARELVRRLNELRREAGFRVEDRIVTYFAGSEDVLRVFDRFADHIRRETLSARLDPGPAPVDAHAVRLTLDGSLAELAVQRMP